MSRPANYTLHIQQGAATILQLNYVDSNGDPVVDLTGYESVLQIRRTTYDTDPALLELTSTGGEITFDSLTGQVEATFPVTKVDALPTNNVETDDWVWGIQIYDPLDKDNTARMLLTGEAIIYPSPVREDA